MARVDEKYVADYLQRAELLRGLEFKPVPADDEGVDAAVEVWRDGSKLDSLEIQVGGGYVALNRYGYQRPGDPASFYMQPLADFGVQPEDLAELVKAVNLEVLRLAKAAA